MTVDEVVRRLRAFEKGKPLPSGEKLRVPRIDPAQIMVLSFVKMGGESAPWGLAFGRPGKGPKVLTVAEPRTRDAVADMMLQFAPVLLTHLHHPQFSSFGPDPEARLPPFQIWLPNDAHVEMLHHLAYAYTFTRFTDSTIDAVRADRRHENSALPKFVAESMTEHRLQYRRMEAREDDAEDGPAFTPSPETDRFPAAAASRFYVHEASQEYLDRLMVHDDRELQARLVATGEAIAGMIVDVRDEGSGRKTIPVWVVESRGDLPLRLREDAEVCVVGLPSRKLRIREIEEIAGRGYRFELVVTALIKGPRENDGSVLPATSPKLKRRKVVLVKPSMDQIARRKSMLIWKRDVPGAWLTHAVPNVPQSTLPRGVAEDLREVGADEP